MAATEFEFRSPQRAQMWRDLALTMSQAAALTGVSERQIQHWMDRGYLQQHDPAVRKINGENLDMIVLIRQARIAGVPLRRAVSLARQYLKNEKNGSLDGKVTGYAVDELVEHVRAVQGELIELEHLLVAVDVTPVIPDSSMDGVSS